MTAAQRANARSILALVAMAGFLAAVSAADLLGLTLLLLAIYTATGASVLHDSACRRLGACNVVYGLHDSRGNLLYIGSSKALPERLAGHVGDRDVEPWKELAVRVSVIRSCVSVPQARRIERRRIRSMWPAQRTNRTVQIRNDLWFGPTSNPVAKAYRRLWMEAYSAEQILRPHLRWLRNDSTVPLADLLELDDPAADDTADEVADDPEPAPSRTASAAPGVLIATYQRPAGRQPVAVAELGAGGVTREHQRDASRVTPHTPPVGGCGTDKVTGDRGSARGRGRDAGSVDSRPLADLIGDAHRAHVAKVTRGRRGKAPASAKAQPTPAAAAPPPVDDGPPGETADERKKRKARERQQRYRAHRRQQPPTT